MLKRLSIKSVLAMAMLSFNAFGSAESTSHAQLLQTKLSSLTSYQADFSQEVVDLENTVLQQAKGKIALKQPNKLYWELLAPNDNILIADGQTLWNVDAFMEQVVAYDQSAAIENNPLILLTDPSSEKWQEYQVEKQSEGFVITPKVNTGSVIKLILTFDDSGQLVGLQTTDNQQQTSTLQFSNIQQNEGLGNAKFIFSLPNGYELDDQRENDR